MPGAGKAMQRENISEGAPSKLCLSGGFPRSDASVRGPSETEGSGWRDGWKRLSPQGTGEASLRPGPDSVIYEHPAQAELGRGTLQSRNERKESPGDSPEQPPANDHVGTAAPGCPGERSSPAL